VRDFLPAISLAVFGLGVLAALTVMPAAGKPAVLVFGSDLSSTERFVRTAMLGGRVVNLPADGHLIYATFDTLPAPDVFLRQGVVVMLNAAGARGCAGQQV
jgi:hypothetical protein